MEFGGNYLAENENKTTINGHIGYYKYTIQDQSWCYFSARHSRKLQSSGSGGTNNTRTLEEDSSSGYFTGTVRADQQWTDIHILEWLSLIQL